MTFAKSIACIVLEIFQNHRCGRKELLEITFGSISMLESSRNYYLETLNHLP